MSNIENVEAAGPNPVQPDPTKPQADPTKQLPGDDTGPAMDVEQDEDVPGKSRKTGETSEGMDAGDMGEKPDADETEAGGDEETGEDEDATDPNTSH